MGLILFNVLSCFGMVVLCKRWVPDENENRCDYCEKRPNISIWDSAQKKKIPPEKGVDNEPNINT